RNPYVAIRSVRVSDPADGTNIYMLRQDCSRVYTNAADYYTNGGNFFSFLDNAYDSSRIPSGTPLDTFDSRGYFFYRNSFHWGPRQAAGLPSNLDMLLPEHFKKARMRHWHHSVHGPIALYISQIL